MSCSPLPAGPDVFIMRSFVVALGLGLLAVLGLVRASAYFYYAYATLPLQFESYHLEAKMVHLAWRVQAGLPLYPDWRVYPHVCNNFGPCYFLLVGWLGKLAGASLDDLFFVGRGVTFASAMLTSAILGGVVGRRKGWIAGVVAALVSVGATPMIGFSVMVRSDVSAECLALVGFLLSGRRSKGWCSVGCVFLVLAILTRQTTGVFLLARAIALLAGGRRVRAGAVFAGSLGLLGVVVATITLVSGPTFASGLLVESKSVVDIPGYLGVVRRIALFSPDLVIFPLFGLVFWTQARPRDIDATILTLVLLATCFGAALKRGADVNYFLSLRIVEALAVGAIWAAARSPEPRVRLRTVPAVYLGSVALAMSAYSMVAIDLLAGPTVTFLQGPLGRIWEADQRAVIRIAEDPGARLLTDSGLFDIHQKERTVFADPYQFRTLVDAGEIVPTKLEDWIESESYDLIVTLSDLSSPNYSGYVFGLPMRLVDRINRHYVLSGSKSGLFFFVRRSPGPTSGRGR